MADAPAGAASTGRSVRLGALVGAAGLIASAAVGLGVGRSGGLDLVDESHTVGGQVDALAPFSACPGGDPIGALHRDDRVYLTGRDDDSAWLELRSPADAADRVWVQAEAVGADDDVDSLPVRSCSSEGAQLALPGETTTTLPPTTVPGETTTTGGQSTPTTKAPTSTTQPSGTTTTVSDKEGPIIATLQRSAAIVYENDQDCPNPRTVVLSAAIADASPFTARVEWRYQSPGKIYTSGQATVAPTGPGGRYEATIGPFAVNSALSPTSTITWKVIATDSHGNSRTLDATANETVTLRRAGSWCVG